MPPQGLFWLGGVRLEVEPQGKESETAHNESSSMRFVRSMIILATMQQNHSKALCSVSSETKLWEWFRYKILGPVRPSRSATNRIHLQKKPVKAKQQKWSHLAKDGTTGVCWERFPRLHVSYGHGQTVEMTVTKCQWPILTTRSNRCSPWPSHFYSINY